MSHELFVAAAYGISPLGILALVAWNLIDQRARKAELADLEARGVRRRSERAVADKR